MKHVFAIVLAVLSGSAQADTFTYSCKANGEKHIVKIDDVKNILVWGRHTYRLKINEDCAKFGWHAIGATDSFDFCTATQGYADFTQNGVNVQCDLR